MLVVVAHLFLLHVVGRNKNKEQSFRQAANSINFVKTSSSSPLLSPPPRLRQKKSYSSNINSYKTSLLLSASFSSSASTTIMASNRTHSNNIHIFASHPRATLFSPRSVYYNKDKLVRNVTSTTSCEEKKTSLSQSPAPPPLGRKKNKGNLRPSRPPLLLLHIDTQQEQRHKS